MENLRNLSRWGMFAFLSVALCTSFVGCSDDDPDYSNVTPPTVSVSHSISGRVTGMDGNGLSATVSMNGESTQTGADGTFTFDDVDAGSYTLTAPLRGNSPRKQPSPLQKAEAEPMSYGTCHCPMKARPLK